MKHHLSRGMRAVVSVAVASLAAVTLVTTTAVAQSSEKVPGVTDKAVKLGFIYSGTGVAASTFNKTGAVKVAEHTCRYLRPSRNTTNTRITTSRS
jgi:hypothetical protein